MRSLIVILRTDSDADSLNEVDVSSDSDALTDCDSETDSDADSLNEVDVLLTLMHSLIVILKLILMLTHLMR